jgi:hypothetical protein
MNNRNARRRRFQVERLEGRDNPGIGLTGVIVTVNHGGQVHVSGTATGNVKPGDQLVISVAEDNGTPGSPLEAASTRTTASATDSFSVTLTAKHGLKFYPVGSQGPFHGEVGIADERTGDSLIYITAITPG